MFLPQPTPFASACFASCSSSSSSSSSAAAAPKPSVAAGSASASSAAPLYDSSSSTYGASPLAPDHYLALFGLALRSDPAQGRELVVGPANLQVLARTSVARAAAGDYISGACAVSTSSPAGAFPSQIVLEHQRVPIKMEEQDQHSLAAQEAAARNYKPDLQGRPIGDKQSSEAITQEYARADPVYVEKTILLPQTYSNYRSVQGDGNCGWRAIGYLYCEKIIELGDRARAEAELNRHRNMQDALGSIGYTFVDDFLEGLLIVLQDIVDNIGNPAVAHAQLLDHWNNPEVANAIIYYLRLLAAYYLKVNAIEYDVFVVESGQGRDTHDYCSRYIEPVNIEIEQMGIIALHSILLKPINFILEIAYLDRSRGSQVTTYRYPEEAKDQDPSTIGPILCLLYRPGHYDILYRPVPGHHHVAADPLSLQVHRVNGFCDNSDIMSTQTNLADYSTCDFTALTMLPGCYPMGSSLSMGPPVSGAPSMSEPFTPPPPPGQWMPALYDGMSAASPSPEPPTPMANHPPMPLRTGHMGAMHAGHSMASPGRLPPPPECTIRFSPLQYEYNEGKNSYPEPTFQVKTNAFKNSVWNRAHFGNPDFHPEEWNPDDEEPRQGRRKSLRPQ